jgi:hypothetical protein
LQSITTQEQEMSDLVRRLSEGQHPIIVSLRPDTTVSRLKECLDRGYVHIKFTETRGGTELGVPIDLERSDLQSADFTAETGTLTLVGALTLDYVKVRCIATVELPSLHGEGRLEVITD